MKATTTPIVCCNTRLCYFRRNTSKLALLALVCLYASSSAAINNGSASSSLSSSYYGTSSSRHVLLDGNPSAVANSEKVNWLDCKLKELAYRTALRIQNNNINTHIDREVYDALQLSKCTEKVGRTKTEKDATIMTTTENENDEEEEFLAWEKGTNVKQQQRKHRRRRRHLRKKYTWKDSSTKRKNMDTTNTLEEACRHDHCYIVDPIHGTDTVPTVISSSNTVSEETQQHHPMFKSIQYTIEYARMNHPKPNKSDPRIILLRDNKTHYLNGRTLRLSGIDSYTTIRSYPGEFAWISGGVLLDNLTWKQQDTKKDNKSGDAAPQIVKCKIPLSKTTPLPANTPIHSLFSTSNKAQEHKRYTLARYPNMNVETDLWGYNSPSRDDVSLNANSVLEWEYDTRSERVDTIHSIHIDLRHHNPTNHTKNNSAMVQYNAYTEGGGGACSDVWNVQDPTTTNPGGGSYWCSPYCDGGWADIVDATAAKHNKIQIPTAMTWNMSNPTLAPLSTWSSLSTTKTTTNTAVVHAWHSQTWAMHMFPIQSFDTKKGHMVFKSGGGSQGGRNWCRCDQCSYAASIWSNDGSFCGRANTTTTVGNVTLDRRLIGGSWFVEGVLEALDSPGEFYFDTISRELYLVLNTTTVDAAVDEPPPKQLVSPILETLIALVGSNHSSILTGITLQDIGFRDSLSTYRSKWGVPSGGDWAMHRSAAVFIENSTNVQIQNCHFRRLDGNALLLAGYTRYVQIQKSVFEYIGQNAAGAWGNTTAWDGTGGMQPQYTTVKKCVFHDVGLFQKQSSAWFQAKSALTTIQENIMFNLPRAAINLNDGFGGGNIIQHNLMFNTCRESGDHGPINTWDRMPFLTNVRHLHKASFDPATNTISHNLIFANYGAGEGVDNDDGSSFYDIFENVFVDSSGFKMDYGGHNSSFHHNTILTKPSASTHDYCIGTGPFLPNITDSYYNNSCYVRNIDPNTHQIGNLDSCESNAFLAHDNHYFTSNGEATLSCHQTLVDVWLLANTTGVGRGDRVSLLPDEPFIFKVVEDKVKDIFSSCCT